MSEKHSKRQFYGEASFLCGSEFGYKFFCGPGSYPTVQQANLLKKKKKIFSIVWVVGIFSSDFLIEIVANVLW
jgi:hypothetical protein